MRILKSVNKVREETDCPQTSEEEGQGTFGGRKQGREKDYLEGTKRGTKKVLGVVGQGKKGEKKQWPGSLTCLTGKRGTHSKEKWLYFGYWGREKGGGGQKN